jgi:outer membrane protein
MKYLIVLLLFFTAVSTPAGELTLELALQLAEEHSHSLKASQANLEAAAQTLKAARAERLPTLSLDARAGYINEIPVLDMSIPGLPPISRELGSKDSYQTDLRLSVPLYTGGRLSAAIKQAESGRDYNQAVEQVEQDNLMLVTRLEFLRLAQAIKLKRAAQGSLERIETLRRGIIARLDAGVADSVALLEVLLASDRASFRSSRASTDVRSAEIKLLTRLGLPADESPQPVVSLADPGEQQLAEIAPADTLPRLHATAALISRSKAELDHSRARFYPTLSAYAGYSYGKPNANPFSDNFNDSYSFGAKLQWSLGLGGGNAAKRNSAAHTLDAARHQYDQLAETLDRDASLAFEQWKLSLRRISSARTERDIAGENYRLAQMRHDHGSLPSYRLLEIEQALTEVEARLAAAQVDFYIAQSIYFYAVGDERLRKGL